MFENLSRIYSKQAVLLFKYKKLWIQYKKNVNIGSRIAGGRFWFERVKVQFWIPSIPVQAKVRTPEVLPYNIIWLVLSTLEVYAGITNNEFWN